MSNGAELMKRLRALGVQLRLEGGTLRLNAPKGALTAELQSELRASKAELVVLLQEMQKNRAASPVAPIGRVERQELMPLSYAQQRLWFLEQMDPGSATYNILALLRMQGNLDEDALERSLGKIVQRHEALRTTFTQRDGSPYSVIGDGMGWKLEKLPLDRREGETLEEAAFRFSEERTEDPFKLETGPLFRAFLLRVDEGEYVLALAIHHIVSDGWSMGVLIRELAENYRAYRLNEPSRLPELQAQYIDYAEWQRTWLENGVLERQMQYWRKQLAGAPAVVLFPPDHARTRDGAGRGKRRKLVISTELTAQLEAFSRGHDATLFMTMLAAFMLLLSRYSGQKDVVVGSPSANRNRAELSELIGFFVNNLVLRVEVEDGISFLALLKRVREATLGAFEHQDAPFDHLVRELQRDRGPEYSPLFQTMFTLQNFPLEELKLPDLTVSPLEIEGSIARFDLTVEIYPYRKELFVYFDYRADLYEDATIAALQQSFEYVLKYVISSPHERVESVPLMSDETKEELLRWGNCDALATSPQSLLLDALDRHVTETPDKIAVRAGSDALTYVQLNARANELARRLRLAGTGRGSLVPVCLNRSTDLLVALLAVLKIGAAYVPLDPIYPQQRIAGILEDVKPEVLITERALLTLVNEYERQCIVLEDGWASMGDAESDIKAEGNVGHNSALMAEDIAYVIFTSGSTGRPKGVEISHGALANFLESMRHAPGFTREDRLLAVTTVSFDIAGLELFLPVYTGGEVIISLAPGDLPTLLEDIEREKPTVMQATPALWQMLVSSGWEGNPGLTVLCGGEALTPQLASTLLSRVKALWNMYGPTETTIWSSALRIEAVDSASVPLGGPIRNTTFYVLDARYEPVPIGVVGELYIGGHGLSQGYLNRPELTVERFITASTIHGVRLYRTGDLVRRRRDGTLEFLGRADFQVKLRGFRIELGEIEHALRQQPEIAESVVLLHEDEGQKELVAYIVFRPNGTLPYVRLRQKLRERIPEYMVPASAVILDSFPRLPNGKLDRTSLAAQQAREHSPQELTYQGQFKPDIGNVTEAAIGLVFRELLHADHIDVDRRFFDLGAHSLMLVKAHDRIRRELDPELRLVSFFQYPTIAALATHIDQSRQRAGEMLHAAQR
jgi:amino acid adenylation domain-containing protein